MADDVVLNKAATIERCVARAREEYHRDPATFAADFTRQDAAILNIQRACEAALDLRQHLIRREKLGVPQSARDVFALLARGGWIDSDLADSLKKWSAFAISPRMTIKRYNCLSQLQSLKSIWMRSCGTHSACCNGIRRRSCITRQCPCAPARA